MSSRHPNARLAGYEGPLYPDGIEVLEKALTKWLGHPVPSGLATAAVQVRAFFNDPRVETADGYIWHGLEFNVPGGKVFFLVSVHAKEDGQVRFERMPAVYRQPDVADSCIGKVLFRLSRAFNR